MYKFDPINSKQNQSFRTYDSHPVIITRHDKFISEGTGNEVK